VIRSSRITRLSQGNARLPVALPGRSTMTPATHMPAVGAGYIAATRTAISPPIDASRDGGRCADGGCSYGSYDHEQALLGRLYMPRLTTKPSAGDRSANECHPVPVAVCCRRRMGLGWR
jgi:hypothetical protein